MPVPLSDSFPAAGRRTNRNSVLYSIHELEGKPNIASPTSPGLLQIESVGGGFIATREVHRIHGNQGMEMAFCQQRVKMLFLSPCATPSYSCSILLYQYSFSSLYSTSLSFYFFSQMNHPIKTTYCLAKLQCEFIRKLRFILLNLAVLSLTSFLIVRA